MSRRNRLVPRLGILLALTFLLVVTACPALGQDQPADEAKQTVTQTSTAPPPPPSKGPDPGPFAKGKVRVGFYGGAGSFNNNTYVILGGGLGYFLLNGLEAGLDAEGWLAQSPNIWKITPHLRYVLWQVDPVRPYVGVFYRKTFMGGDWADYESWGGRGGIAYRKGGSFVALGVVYENFMDYTGPGDNYTIYPEIAFWISF